MASDSRSRPSEIVPGDPQQVLGSRRVAAMQQHGIELGRLWLNPSDLSPAAEGYAVEKHHAPNTRYRVELQQAEAEARAAGRGLSAARANRL